MNRRRRHLVFVSTAVLASGFVRAQDRAGPPRIGFVSAGGTFRTDDFRAGLKDAGYIEGKTIIVEYRSSDSNYDRVKELTRALVRMPVHLLVTVGTPATRAAQESTTSIPIVFIGAGDPVGSGFVKTLARPGGNITGLSNISTELAPKRLEVLLSMLPRISRVGALLNPATPTRDANLKALQAEGQKRAVTIVPLDARNTEELEQAFARASQNGVRGIVVQQDTFFRAQHLQIVSLAAKAQIPTCYAQPEFVTAGGLVSYSHVLSEQSKRAAIYVDKILKGASPADLPVERPTTFELAINVRTAKALGIAVPQSVLLQASRVIE